MNTKFRGTKSLNAMFNVSGGFNTLSIPVIDTRLLTVTTRRNFNTPSVIATPSNPNPPTTRPGVAIPEPGSTVTSPTSTAVVTYPPIDDMTQAGYIASVLGITIPQAQALLDAGVTLDNNGVLTNSEGVVVDVNGNPIPFTGKTPNDFPYKKTIAPAPAPKKPIFTTKNIIIAALIIGTIAAIYKYSKK